MNKYFKTAAETYESIRNAMDAESGYPNNVATTWFTPAEQAPKSTDGDCLIAAINPIADRFIAEGVTELTESEYTNTNTNEYSNEYTNTNKYINSNTDINSN
jgi:hypothetical protein